MVAILGYTDLVDLVCGGHAIVALLPKMEMQRRQCGKGFIDCMHTASSKLTVRLGA